MPTTYDIGDLVRVAGTFTRASDGAAIDPSTVALLLREPNGATTTYRYGTDAEVVKVSTGSYRADLSPTMAGIHFYRWESTGLGQAAEESRFEVRKTKVMA